MYYSGNPTHEGILNGTGNSFPMLIFENFKVVIKKWNSYPGMAQKNHIAKCVFFIFKVLDFCFIDQARKTNKHKNTAMELKSSIIFFAILREEPIVYQEVQTFLKSVGK